MNRVLRYSLAIAWLLPICAVSQPIEQVSQDGGLPFYLRHFPAHEYRAHPQNWSIVQDERGIIYVGNYDGVLIYDGDSWETIQTPSNTTVRSLSVGASGYVYVGLQGDFGYLTADSTGQYKYVSLLDFVPADERGFWDVWGSHATDDYAFFQTKDQIFRWDGKSLRIWKSTSGYHTSFRVGNDIFVRERGVGLLRLVGDTLSLIPDGERFADEQVFVVDLTRAGELLIATQKSGLFLHDGQNVRPFPTNADDFLEQHRLYHGAVLETGYIVLGMLDGGGLIILNSDGRVVEHLTESKGLPDGWVNYVYVDAQGGLWIALNNHGLVRFDPLSSISK